MNAFSKICASRVLGRVHAAKGEHVLSVSALNSALEAAKTGELLLSEALVVRGRSRIGRELELKGSSGHWDEAMAAELTSELMARMHGPRSALEALFSSGKQEGGGEE